jgi:gliding motility-associated-like protein
LPDVTVTGQEVCPAEVLQFTATPGYQYAWSINGSSDPTQNGNVYGVTNTTAGTVEAATVTVTDANGCSSSAMKAVTVKTPPNAPMVKNYVACACSGKLEWSNLISGMAGTVRWYESPTGVATITPPTIDKSVVSTSTLYVAVDGLNGCHSTIVPVSSTVNPNPVVSGVNKDDLRNIQVMVENGQAPYNYTVENKKGVATGIIDLGIVFFGNHEVSVVDANGCKASITFVVDPLPLEPEKYFTPNDDGENDTWDIANIDFYPLTDIFIHDRFGKEVAKYTGSTFHGWDGKYLGNSLPATDYWYVIQVRETGKRLMGHFLLKR